MEVMAIKEMVNGELFTLQSTIGLSVFRIFVGLLILVESLQWVFLFRKFVSVNGYFDWEIFEKYDNGSHWTLLRFLPKNNGSVNALIMMQFISAVLILLGIYPQLAAILCFIASTSLLNRNPMIFDAGDHVRRFFCFFLIFFDTSQHFSVLHLNNFINAQEKAWPWMILMIQLFMANIYLKNVWFKLNGKFWREGLATGMVFNVSIWNRFSLPKILDVKAFFYVTTYGTLLIETALFTLIWFDFIKIYVVITGIIFHLCLGIFLRIGFFQFTMVAGLLTFIPSEIFIKIIDKITGIL